MAAELPVRGWLLASLALACGPGIGSGGPRDLGRPAAPHSQAPAGAPSVLFLISDDHHADALGAFGNEHLRTPNLDRLVERGFSFRGAYCMGSTVAAVCAPSRAMLLSGKTLFHLEGSVYEQQDPDPILPEAARLAGWTTFATGKWHNGRPWFHRAFDRGDAIFHGGMGPHRELPLHHFDPTGRYPDDERYTSATFSSELFADATLAFLEWLGEQADERPFLAWVAFTAPHDPRTPPGAWRALYDPDAMPLPASFAEVHPFDNGDMMVRDELLAPWPRLPEVIQQHVADYYGMISHLDAQVGRILEALEERGRAERTLVVFLSDHGLSLGGHGLLGKQNLYEDSMRAPLVLAGPGVPHGSSEALVYLHDLYPTVCELLGIEVPDSVEGRSLVPLLEGRGTGRESIFTAYLDVQRAVRDERFKLITYPQVGLAQLFDLERDPHELEDLFGQPEHEQRTLELVERLLAWQAELDDPAGRRGR